MAIIGLTSVMNAAASSNGLLYSLREAGKTKGSKDKPRMGSATSSPRAIGGSSNLNTPVETHPIMSWLLARNFQFNVASSPSIQSIAVVLPGPLTYFLIGHAKTQMLRQPEFESTKPRNLGEFHA